MSFGHPVADYVEFRLLLIATFGGGIGAYQFLLIQNWIAGKNHHAGYIVGISFPAMVLIGSIMGFLLFCLAHAGILKLNMIVDVADPFSVLGWSAITGFFALPIASMAAKNLENWFLKASKLWQAIKEVIIADSSNDQ